MTRANIGVVLSGAVTILFGAVAMASGVGAIPMGPSDPTVPLVHQRAVAFTAGAVFAAGGAAALLTLSSATWSVRARNALAFLIAVGLTLLLGWVAVGPGARDFSGPTEALGPRLDEIFGRLAFGVGALLGLTLVVYMIRRGWRSARPPPDAPPAP